MDYSKCLYMDVQLHIFSFLTLAEFVAAGCSHKAWLHTTTTTTATTTTRILLRNYSATFRSTKQFRKAMASPFGKYVRIASFKFYNNNDGGIIKSLASVLKNSKTSITSVDLSNNSIRTEGVKVLSNAFSVNRLITSLNLSSCMIGDEGVNALKIVKTSITSINLSYNNIGARGAQMLAHQFEKFKTSITNIDLSGNRIGISGIKALLSSLESVKTIITSIKLGNCKICYEGVKLIASALEHNKHITSIGLYSNQIDTKGAKLLLSVLEINTSITAMDLSRNMIALDQVPSKVDLRDQLGLNSFVNDFFYSDDDFIY